MTRALLEQALVALEGVLDAPVGVAAQFWSCSGGVYEAVECNNAINALQAELAKPDAQQAPQVPMVAKMPFGWRVRSDGDVFKTITITAPNGYSAVTTNVSRNPENVLRMLVQDLLSATPEIDAWNAAVEAKRAAKKERKKS